MAKGQKTGGRKPGTPNKATADIREAAQAFTTDALNTLASVMMGEDGPAAARVAAAVALLDRGYGKPNQAVVGDADAAPIKHSFSWLNEGS